MEVDASLNRPPYTVPDCHSKNGHYNRREKRSSANVSLFNLGLRFARFVARFNQGGNPRSECAKRHLIARGLSQ